MALTKPTRVEIPGKSRYVIQINSLMSLHPAKKRREEDENGSWKMKDIYNKNQFSGSIVQSRVIPGTPNDGTPL